MSNCSNDYKQDFNPRQVKDVLESGSNVPEADSIDYLKDTNVAIQDIINIFEAMVENVEESLICKETQSEIPNGESRNDKNDIPKEISKAGSEFLTKLKLLVNCIEERIKLSPTEKQERNRKLRDALRSSRKTEMEIKLLKDVLNSQRMEHKKSMDKFNEELNDCLKLTNQKKEEIENEIKRIVNESELKMIDFYKDSIARQELIRSEIEISKTRLNNLRKNNILMEKELREKRCKVESQLLDCLAKYDSDIGGRHKEMENLSEEFSVLNSQKKMLEDDVMINLRNLHDILQEEKAQALQKILNEKVDKFVRNRAARIIQIQWRAHWERVCSKKKKKSRKK